jgi:hypothetical protein
MAVYVTQIEKHRFVCGLFWQSLSRPRELAKEAAELGRKIDSDLMVLRTDQSTAQAGFAQSADGARRGMFSLGAIVSKTLAIEGAYYDGQKQRVHNWLAALKLPDGKWVYFAVRDANFLPNGDFAGTKEEVLERLHGDYGLGGWNVVIGDPELANYGFHNFEARSVEDLIPHRKNGSIRVHRWWALQQLHTKRSYWPIVAAAGLAAVVAGAAYWQYQQKKQQDIQRDLDIAAARQKMKLQAASASQPPPWSGKPSPQHMAQACVDRLTYLTPGGWRLDDYVCTVEQVSYVWSRNQSTMAYLRAQVPGAEVEPSGEKATYSEPLKLERKDAEAVLDQKELLEPIVSAMQLMGVVPQISSVAPNTPGGDGLRPAWRAFTYKLNTRGLAPTTVAAVLEKPGVRIDKLSYRGGEWSIEGVMYVK